MGGRGGYAERESYESVRGIGVDCGTVVIAVEFMVEGRMAAW